MEFRLLGPLEVWVGDGPLRLGGLKQRALLAMLLLNANRVVSQSRLVDAIWDENPPNTALQALHVYVSEVRKLLPTGTLLTRRPGYLLQVEPESVDVLRFERLVATARDAEPAHAAGQLREALGLWRGPALSDLVRAPFARVEAGRLEDLRLAALEDRIEADLALGCHAELIGELETLIAEQPHRERLRGQLMLALYRGGRQPDALEAYRAAWATLDELGLEPSTALRNLEKQILTQDPSLDSDTAAAAGSPVPPPAAPASEAPLPTGTVTFLFTDIDGSTELFARVGPGRYAELLTEHRRVLREAFAEAGGREVDTQGDAFFVAFAGATGALQAAVRVQQSLA